MIWWNRAAPSSSAAALRAMLVLLAVPACSTPGSLYTDGYAQGCEEGERDGAEEAEKDGAACNKDDDPPRAPLPRLLAGDSWNDGYEDGYPDCWIAVYVEAYDDASFEADCPID